MTHSVLTAIVLFIFWSFILPYIDKMVKDKNALLRFIGYASALSLAIATVLIVLTQYVGIEF